MELGCFHILLSTFLIFQSRSCHINALQPLSRTVKQTRAWKGHSTFDSQWKRELCDSEFSQLPFWRPCRKHEPPSPHRWIKMIMAETENSAHLSVWRNSASLSNFKMLNSKTKETKENSITQRLMIQCEDYSGFLLCSPLPLVPVIRPFHCSLAGRKGKEREGGSWTSWFFYLWAGFLGRAFQLLAPEALQWGEKIGN